MSLYGELWLKYKNLYGDQEFTFNSFNVWVIYRITTLEHLMVSFFLILEG